MATDEAQLVARTCRTEQRQSSVRAKIRATRPTERRTRLSRRSCLRAFSRRGDPTTQTTSSGGLYQSGLASVRPPASGYIDAIVRMTRCEWGWNVQNTSLPRLPPLRLHRRGPLAASLFPLSIGSADHCRSDMPRCLTEPCDEPCEDLHNGPRVLA